MKDELKNVNEAIIFIIDTVNLPKWIAPTADNHCSSTQNMHTIVLKRETIIVDIKFYSLKLKIYNEN